MSTVIEAATISWLLDGDPAIRWQVMRDLLDAPASEWTTERNRVASEGWGAQFLSHQLSDGSWPAGRWTDTTWTLLLLMDCGLPPAHESILPGIEWVIGRLLPPGQPVERKTLLTRMDLCHLGFWLRFGSYFNPADERLGPIAETILNLQMDDGGWNCQIRTKPKTRHSSFHTTFNVLDGLRDAATAGIIEMSNFQRAEERAMEFMAAHQMYRSDKTGEVISDRFTALSHPSHWHYTVLRGLDYVRQTKFISDQRLADPLDMIRKRQFPNGRWPVEKRIPGVTFFDMERFGGESRWNTLRALRVLRGADSLTQSI